MGAERGTVPNLFASCSGASRSAQNQPPRMNLFRLQNPPRAISRRRRSQSAANARAAIFDSTSKWEVSPRADSSGILRV